MAKTKDQQLMLKWKRKKWFTVKARAFNNKEIGQAMAESPEQLIGRFVTMNMMYLTNDPRKQGINVLFKITKTEGSNGIAEVYGYNLINAMIKRLVRKRTKRVDDSFILKTKDNKYVIVKPFIVTRTRVSRNVRSAIRKFTRTYLLNYFEHHTYEDFVKNVLNDSLVNELKSKLYKITPILHTFIRVFKLIEEPSNKQKRLYEEFKETVKAYNIQIEEKKEKKPKKATKSEKTENISEKAKKGSKEAKKEEQKE